MKKTATRQTRAELLEKLRSLAVWVELANELNQKDLYLVDANLLDLLRECIRQLQTKQTDLAQ